MNASNHTTVDVNSAVARRLIIDTVPHDLDPKVDLVLGPWCFLHNDDVLAASNAYPAEYWPKPLSDDEISARADAIRKLVEYKVAQLTSTFNQRHNTDWSREYWRVLLAPWLALIYQAVWMRYEYVRRFTEQTAAKNIVVKVDSQDRTWSFSGLLALHHEVLWSPVFDNWLTSMVIRALCPENWSLDAAETRAANDWVASDVTSVSTVSASRCNRVKGIRWMAPAFSALLSVLPSKRPMRHTPAVPDKWEIDSLFDAAFLSLADEIVERMTPSNLGDEYANYASIADKQTYRAGKVRLVGPILIYNEADKFVIARAVEAGELIVCSQHGGSGYQKVNCVSVLVENSQDAYFSWGWKSQEDYPGRFIRVPSPMFSPYRNRHKRRNDSLFMVVEELRVLPLRLQTAHQPLQAYEARNERVRFLEELPDNIRSRIKYRPAHVGAAGLPDEEYMRDTYPSLDICRGSLEPQMLKGKLLVVDHPTTTFCVAMTANMPTVLLLHEDVWTFSRQATPIFDRLRNVGIVVTSGTEAAQRVADVWDDVDDWWQNDALQAARAGFCNQYAQTNPFWYFKWARALIRL